MCATPNWQREEVTHVGTDFSDPAEVNTHVRVVTNDSSELDAIIANLDLGAEHALIDFGCGPGDFAVKAAAKCRKVYAVDISSEMLTRARTAAEEAGLANMEFHRAGFLSYEHAGEPVDVITSHKALHHLPDIWKQVALVRMAAMLKPGGRLHLQDAVFTFQPTDYVAAFDGFVAGSVRRFGPEVAPKVIRHIRDEFSTFDWIMEGLLCRAGFRIDRTVHPSGLEEYYCTKVT